MAFEDGRRSPEAANEEDDALLINWKESEAERDERTATTSRPNQRSVLVWAAIASAIILAVLAAITVLSRSNTAFNEHGSSSSTTRSQDDYILDSKWDFYAPPQRREFYWTIKDHVRNPDGIYRPMILANSMFPGPLIEVNEGDTIVVHVNNLAVNATAIHWHGIYQNSTPYMDGTVGVTQCPIPPGGKFTYEFTVSGQSGTYWWHGHYGVQASDGLYGPLIIHSRREKELKKIDYATDRIIMISDHYHDLSAALLWQYLKPDMENAEPVPNGGLINGQGIRNCEEFPHRKCNNATFNVRRPTFDLARGQHHRLRLINVGAFAEFQVQIDEHELAVTEVDGTDVTPVKYHRVNILPAQRYSVIVKASEDKFSPDAFWLRARMITSCFTKPPENLEPDVHAVVRYASKDRIDPRDIPTSVDWKEKLDMDCRDMNASDLQPVEVVDVPKRPDSFFYIRSNFEIGAYRLSRGFFNASSWRPNIRSPSLIRAIDGLTASNSSFTSKTVSDPMEGSAFINDVAFDVSRELVVQTTGIQTIDILVSNFDDGNHPLHLHGYKYFVLAQGQGYPPLTHIGADINLENLAPLYQSLNTVNPLRRDTASVDAFGWILLRFVADNPGAWAFHCHLSWHAEAGLLMQFLTRSDKLSKTDVPNPSVDLCTAYGLERGMAPEDAAYEDLAR